MRMVLSACVVVCASAAFSYTNLTPSQVHDRIAAGDDFLLLDVRERPNEYAVGHIAEPQGHLPVTPANMPLTSGVLSAQYQRLPGGIDIIVYCASGNRSTRASDSLEKWGFARVYNMTSGFNGWSQAGYETRAGGFGDHSGVTILPVMSAIFRVGSAETEDSSLISVDARMIPQGIDSMYVELHSAWGKQPIPADVPSSGVHGLYRLTVLDSWGVPLFTGDSMTTPVPMPLRLAPVLPAGVVSAQQLSSTGLRVRQPSGAWASRTFSLDFPVYEVRLTTLYHWYATTGEGAGSAVRRVPGPAPAKRSADRIRGASALGRVPPEGYPAVSDQVRYSTHDARR